MTIGGVDARDRPGGVDEAGGVGDPKKGVLLSSSSIRRSIGSQCSVKCIVSLRNSCGGSGRKSRCVNSGSRCGNVSSYSVSVNNGKGSRDRGNLIPFCRILTQGTDPLVQLILGPVDGGTQRVGVAVCEINHFVLSLSQSPLISRILVLPLADFYQNNLSNTILYRFYGRFHNIIVINFINQYSSYC